MTPRSSWWQSTSERGGGLVCWLETLRALIAEPPMAEVVMTANSGHELGSSRVWMRFWSGGRGWDGPNGAIWVHYGANIGATGGRVVDPVRRRPVARGDAAGVDRVRPGRPTRWRRSTQVPNGETQRHSSCGRPLRHAGREQPVVSFASGSLASRGGRSGDRSSRAGAAAWSRAGGLSIGPPCPRRRLDWTGRSA